MFMAVRSFVCFPRYRNRTRFRIHCGCRPWAIISFYWPFSLEARFPSVLPLSLWSVPVGTSSQTPSEPTTRPNWEPLSVDMVKRCGEVDHAHKKLPLLFSGPLMEPLQAVNTIDRSTPRPKTHLALAQNFVVGRRSTRQTDVHQSFCKNAR